MREHQYYVYILMNRRGLTYTGATNHLIRRIDEHKQGRIGFTARYRVNRLVYYESCDYIKDTIAREKQIKGWLRSKKLALIRTMNPQLRDLSYDLDQRFRAPFFG